jgi:TonB family protein
VSPRISKWRVPFPSGKFIGSLVLLAALCSAAAFRLSAQDIYPVPSSVYFDWQNFQFLISPDSGGIYLRGGWSDPRKPREARRFATGTDPEEIALWVPFARRFLNDTLTPADTGVTRTSIFLQGRRGHIYLLRRREKGQWSDDRFLLMQSDSLPVVIKGSSAEIGAIVDSMEAVARRMSEPGVQPVASLERFLASTDSIHLDVPPSANPSNRAPDYPETERAEHREGTVLLAFIVGADNKVDMSTIHVMHSPGSGFLMAVVTAFPRFRFKAAISEGRPVSYVVVMPFTFKLTPSVRR